MASVAFPVTGRPTTRPRSGAAPFFRFRPRLAFGLPGQGLPAWPKLETMHHEGAPRELCMAIRADERRRSHCESPCLTAEDIVPTFHRTLALSALRDLRVQGWRFRTDDEGVFLKAPGTCVMHSTQYTPFVGVTIRPYLGHLLDVETT